MKGIKRITGLVLAAALVVGLFSPVQGVSAAAKAKISEKKLTLTVGQSKVLTVKKGSKKLKGVKWSSSKKKVATVSSGGKVKAKKAGKTTITAKAQGKKYTCKVTVKNKVNTEESSTEQNTTEKKTDTSTTPSTPSSETPTTPGSETSTTPSTPGSETSTTPSTPSSETSITPGTPSSETPTTPDTPENPGREGDESLISDEELKTLVTPKTSYEWVDRKATKTEDGVEKIINEDIQKYTIKWNKKDEKGNYHLPSTAEQIGWIDRSGGGKGVSEEDDDGRFLVAALYFCALRAYDPKNETEFDNMMKVLIDSPTAKKVGGTYGASTAQNAKLNLKKKLFGVYKYTYMGNAYFKGATPENQYTPDNPPAIVLEDYVYAAEPSTTYGTDIYKITVRFAGADSERLLSVYKDKEDGQWYIFSDTYLGFTADIRRPQITNDEVADYLNPVDYKESDQPVVTIKTVDRDAQDPNDTSKIVKQPITQAQITFENDSKSVLPTNGSSLNSIDRRGPELIEDSDNKNRMIPNLEKDKGRFMTIAAYFAALKAWTPENADNVYDMMESLCESPTSRALDSDVFTNLGRSFFKDNLTKELIPGHPKYTYIGNSYFDGASPYNMYTPDEPLTVTVEDYVYDGIWSDDYQCMIYTVIARFDGADTERLLKMYQDPFDLRWYIFSDSYKSFISDVKNPILNKEEVLEKFYNEYSTRKDISYNAEKQPVISTNTVYRDAQDPNDKSKIIKQPVTQAQITFKNNGNDVFPKDSTSLNAIDRRGPELIQDPNNTNRKMADIENDTGRFMTIAAYFAALKNLNQYDNTQAYKMMELLCESPTSCALGSDVFNSHSQSFMKDNVWNKKVGLTEQNKSEILGNSYFDGADRFNNYTPGEPLTVTVEDYVYDGIWSNDYNTYIYTVITRFKGADSERLLKMYQDPYDNQWYIFSDSWKSFCSDIKDPVPASDAKPRTDYVDADQPQVNSSTANGKYVVVDEETGEEKIKDGSFVKKEIIFGDSVPSNATELSKISRQGPELVTDSDGVKVPDLANDDGRFKVAALYCAALKSWTPETSKDVDAMMEVLCESPTTKALGEDVYNNYSISQMTSAMKQNSKYSYLGNSYFNGANRYNEYTPYTPYTVTLEDYAYNGIWSNAFNCYIYTVVMKFAGADSPRLLKVYQDPFDLEWYIFSDSWRSFIVDIKKPANKSTATPRSDYNEADQPEITEKEVDGKYIVVDEATGEETVKNGKYVQKTVTFDKVPQNAEELKKISRKGDVVKKDELNRNVTNLESDKGRFVVAALYISALKAWTPETADDVDEMMEVLCESPTSKAIGSDIYNNQSKKFMSNAMKQNNKYTYIGNSYFEGSSPENGYNTDSTAVVVEDYAYDGIWSDDYETKIYTVVVRSSGADSPRLLKVYQDPFDLEWYIFSDSWKSLVVDVREPETE